jgi:3-oxoacyl-[acyl-carrier protein] reductase
MRPIVCLFAFTAPSALAQGGVTMQLDFTGTVVIVTGAARGIGRAIAERFLTEGAKVAALDVGFPDDERAAFTEKAAASAHEVTVPENEGAASARLLQVACDVTDAASVDAAIDRVLEFFGRVDVLINNAGITVDAPFEEVGPERFRRVMDVNVTGPFLLARAVAPIMKRQQRGRIINAASFAAIVPAFGGVAYATSKAAVVQLTKVLAGELGPWNITVNAYAPGMIPTAMNGFADMPAAQQSRLLDTLTLRRWGETGDIADLLCFLASDAAGYITGALIDVSGGKLATQIPSKAYEVAGLVGAKPADATPVADGSSPAN